MRRLRVAGVLAGVLLAASVAVFASLNAWKEAPPPLANTVESPEALGTAVLAAVQAGDAAALEALALTEDEFAGHVWPELPASRPERNLPMDFVWGLLRQNSYGYLQETLAKPWDTPLTLKRVQFAGDSTTYEDVTVHRETQLVVEGPDGREQVLRLFGSTIEQDGRYKVFSFVID